MSGSPNDNPHASRQTMAPRQYARFDPIRDCVSRSASELQLVTRHVRRASEVNFEEDGPSKKARVALPTSDSNLSYPEQDDLPRLPPFTTLYAPLPDPGSQFEPSTSQPWFHEANTIDALADVPPIDINRALSADGQSASLGSSPAAVTSALAISSVEGQWPSAPHSKGDSSTTPVAVSLSDPPADPSINTQHTRVISNTSVPNVNWVLLARFGIPRGSDLTQLPQDQAIALLDQIYIVRLA
ncbi:hypothetical protein DL93DRAFT_920942 [Clavulina sp. PMI_390]|nr:hypothetical protein DL93DRAFT_920942 [Clavulina sp. PMI_390]